MKSTTLLLGIALLGMTTLGGCVIYDTYDDDDDGYTYCDESGCWYCDDYGCYPDGDNGWGTCTSNYDCAAGCYCAADGSCQEQGFCSTDADCPDGFVCDDRASCVPEGSDTGCNADEDCPEGSFCDEMAGVCVGSGQCTDDTQCPVGMACNVERGTCEPVPCTSDDQCLEGCYCNEDTGACEESGTCTEDADCGEGFECDTGRATCVPCENGTCDDPDPGLCYGEVVCDVVAPSCPAGSLPGVLDGCYTGFCIPEAVCPDEPPFECRDATTEAECDTYSFCESVFVGIDCTDPDGNSCTDPDASDCTCDHFEFGFCRDKTSTPAP